MVWMLGLGLSACGNNVIGGSPDGGAAADAAVPDDYPPGPYGIDEGNTVQNFVFRGYVNDAPEDGVVNASGYEETVSFADLRQKGYRYMLFNVAAVWCASCQVEAREFPGHFEDWAPKGGIIVSTLIEDSIMNPATKEILDQWINMYSPNYTMLHDPQGLVFQAFAPATLPLNAMIDLQTMKIIRVRIGDDPQFFQFFEDTLDQ